MDEAAANYGFDPGNMVAVGYSNGANIASSLLFHYKDIFRAAVLLHPMVPLRNIELPSLENVSIFIGAGTNDPLIASAETQDLEAILQKAGAEVTTHWGNQGHRLSIAEAEAARDWLQERSASTNV